MTSLGQNLANPNAPQRAASPARPVAAAPEISALRRLLPNWLTASRVVMAVVFFAVLTAWRLDHSPAVTRTTLFAGIDWFLLLAAALFGIAGLTDALDGHLARKWKVESVFGRIMDPFADKILIVGAFVFLAGPDFWQPLPETHPFSGKGIQLSGVYPWMVVLMLARELLVTSIRGVLEGQGITFASDWWGKWKMILQSVLVPAVLVLIAVAPVSAVAIPSDPTPWGRSLIDVLVWLTLILTVVSGIPYVRRCVAILAQWRREEKQQRRAG
ncbi:MAG: CDP-alcohol phosphatidyltransferase family protein [Planctomycetaceae bacterium]|jgi:phosphatidylglycerophosphate synthase|nr:CDP-alcohol phosphatidyltransferase family protein [Phycisphaerales bacterium]MCE2654471.1 CDP-alcohol phosphatidyltransferase family protein [Planctomycetaceae bacterium]